MALDCYSFPAQPLTSENGTVVLTGTGFTTTVEVTATFQRSDNIFCITIPTISGTSNATTFSVTGLPERFAPLNRHSPPVFATDNGTNLIAAGEWSAESDASTDFILYRDLVLSTSWTAAGTKRLFAASYTWLLP